MSINWTSDINFIHHEQIIEYDIKSANTSLMSYYKLAPESAIDKLRNMKKEDREISVGLRMRKFPEFATALEKAFTSIVELFIKENSLNREEDIISIKKDAVFVRNHPIKITTFGDCVEFRPKGKYDGFLQIPRFEFYHTKENTIDVKGINNELLPLHADGVIEFIQNIFYEARNKPELYGYLKEYSKCYKCKLLSFNSYRQFNGDSKFLVRLMGQDIFMDTIDDSLIDSVDISYNYISVFMEVLHKIL